MTDFLTVLAAVDDSPASVDTMRLAAALAKTGGGDRLFAAHAAPAIPAALEAVLYPYACFGDDYDALRSELARGAGKHVARRIKDLLPGPAAELLHVTQGPAVDALLELASRLGPDLVVVGPGGHDGGAARRVGGVAAGLVRRLACPVAFARPSADEPVTIGAILVALDLGDDAAQVLTRAILLGRRLGATVQPVFVLPSWPDGDPAASFYEQDRGSSGKARKAAGARWTQVESQLELPFPIASAEERAWRSPIFTTGDPGAKIAEVAAETGADLVVVGRCRRGDSGQRLGRVAEYVVRHAPTHVLVLDPVAPENAAA